MVTPPARRTLRAWATFALAAAAPACASDHAPARTAPVHDSKASDMTQPELQIVVDTTYAMTTGYGHAWKASVREVKVGELADPALTLLTVANREGNRYNGRFRNLGADAGVTLTLRKVAVRPAALAGFVAKDGTIWELVGVQ